MTAELLAIHAKLVDAWTSLPDNPPAAQVDELCHRSGMLVGLIGWIEEHPSATRAQYQTEMARVRRGGAST